MIVDCFLCVIYWQYNNFWDTHFKKYIIKSVIFEKILLAT